MPVGSYTLRVEREPYAVAEAPGVRVHADHTRTLDVELPLAAAVRGVQVLNVPEPVAPRDHVTSRTIIDAAAFQDLPITDVRHVVALQAGVVETDDARGVSIRGSEPGEAALYIDGALIRNGLRGEAKLLLGTNAIEEAAVTTGALAAEVGDAQSGVVSFVTRAGGPRYQASLRYRTDDVGFDPWRNVAFNRLEASLGGPIRGNLTFFTALILNGQQSLDTEKLRDVQAPVYVMSGIDTVVRQPTSVGDPTSDTLDVAIPRFVQYSGYCDAARNDGVACQGLRVPFTANGSYTWHGKVQHTYGSGSRLSLTGLASRSQERDFPGVHLYNPTSYTGTRLRSSAVILNWTQSLARLTGKGKALALGANVSYHSDARISGLLARQSELDTRAAFGGFLVEPLDFLVDFNSAHDVQIGRLPGNVTNYKGVKYLDDVQLRCLLAGQASCRDLVPFLDRDDLLPTQPYRLNPYAVEQSTRHPFWTQGLDGIVDLGRETRWQARASLDWQLDRYNQIRVGGEYYRFDTQRYSAGLLTPFGINAYHEKPARQAAYIEDRLDLGSLVIVGGLRWDRFDSRASFPYTPGRISSIIVDTLISGSDTVVFKPFDPLNPEANFVEAPAHDAWSPRVQVSVPLTERTTFRFSYAHQVQAPAFDDLFRAKNTDLTLTNRNQWFGRELDFRKSVIAEAGLRQVFGRETVLDVAVYDKDVRAGMVVRLVRLPDPGEGGSLRDFWVFTNAHRGHIRGVDVRLDRRLSNLFSGSLVYTHQSAEETSSIPTHTIGGWAALTLPNDWRAGTRLGTILENTGLFATFRFASGGHYTRLDRTGFPSEPLNASTLPWFRTVDVRVKRGFKLGRLDATLFAESRNLLNFTNVVNLFTETGEVANPVHRTLFVAEQIVQLESEAAAEQLLKFDPATQQNYVDFQAADVCTRWSARSGQGGGGPVDCVLLVRAERRFGNGDRLLTRSEFSKAFDAWYDLANAPYRFYGPGRRIRLGVDISF